MNFEIMGISGVMTGINNAAPVLIDNADQLGTIILSGRYKEDSDDAEPETVKYHLLATLLLNELQKQRSEFQTLQQVIVDQAAQVIVDQAAHLVSLVEQNRAHESAQERLVALEAKVAELTALTASPTQSVTPVSEVQLALN